MKPLWKCLLILVQILLALFILKKIAELLGF